MNTIRRLRSITSTVNLRRACCSFASLEERQYIDQWLRSVTKPAEFYEEHAAHRRYFYNIDLEGRLFLEETNPKNISCSLKSENFLNVFFKRIRRPSYEEKEKIGDKTSSNDYPFVSPCGNEMNFIRPADSAVVFHGLEFTPKIKNRNGKRDFLIFGGSLRQSFSFESIYISRRTHRIYHKLLTRSNDNDYDKERPIFNYQESRTKLFNSKSEFGLIKSSLAVELAEYFEEAIDHDGLNLVLPDSPQVNKIPWLPSHAEPGVWGMRID